MSSTFMTCYPDGDIGLIVRLETEAGAYGEELIELKPGQSIGQYTYAELRAHGSGLIDIDFEAQRIERLAA